VYSDWFYCFSFNFFLLYLCLFFILYCCVFYCFCAAIWRNKEWLGRPSHTWLRAIEADMGPLNFGLATAWRKPLLEMKMATYRGHSNAPVKEYAMKERRRYGVWTNTLAGWKYDGVIDSHDDVFWKFHIDSQTVSRIILQKNKTKSKSIPCHLSPGWDKTTEHSQSANLRQGQNLTG